MRRTKTIWARGLLLAAVSGMSAVSADAAITHRYSFNDGTANDSVGTAHGSLENGASVAGGILVLNSQDGSSSDNNDTTGDYVNLPNNVAKTSAFTIEGFATWAGGNEWQRTFDFGNTDLGERNPGAPDVGYNGQNVFWLTPRSGYGDANRLHVQIVGGATSEVSRAAEFPRTGEHHFAVTKSGNTLTLYLDGAQVGQNTGATADGALTDQVNAWIGRSNYGNDPFYNGTINEFRIFDNALPADAVAFNAAQGPNGSIAVPEPTSAALLGLGLITLLGRRKRGC